MFPRVTEHVHNMVRVLEELVDRGLAYVIDGEVYMKVSEGSFGSLTGRSLEEMVVQQVSSESELSGQLDFALWKKGKDGEPTWPSPWGDGRPGWHVECYVMATKYLGPTFDIHAGGKDLIFPHHESEDIISRALGKGEFARLWLHSGFMAIHSEPMSKSLGNFVTIRDTLGEFEWEVLRYFIIKTHYRATANYSEEALREAEAEHREVAAAIKRVQEAMESRLSGEDESLLKQADLVRIEFLEAMDDDLNTPRATEALLGLARAVSDRQSLPTSTAQSLFGDFCEYCSVLGLCEEELEV